MKKYVILLTIIISLFINTTMVSAVSSRVIYNFTQYSETKGEIELSWNVDNNNDEIQIISYYLTNDNVLEVTYRVGSNIPKGFNKMTIDRINFPVRIILKMQKAEQDILTDLPEDKVNRYDILNLYDRGIINGYEDNSFKPNNNVVRAEFFAMLAATADYEIDTQSESIFKDVDNAFWGRKYIMTLANKGIVSGNGNGLCNPKGDITIGEVLKIIDKTFRFHDESSSYKAPTVNHWSNENFVNMAKADIVRDIDIFYNPYKPNMKATRQQCATILSRVLQTNYTIK
ncbi:S-layer homology domain-containing protein [Vallitalea guaymasensis]|uniref:S-layer homology domain-containing protein n=1 Tax=Vallitalea guaymasensis TaxID=1185412 RepID=UPI00272A228E|nr:S-layer homology domain-containing protein [Vallitalea guaymasensis]